MVRSTDAEGTLPGSRSWLYLLRFNNPKSLLPYLLKKCLCHRFVQRMAWDDRCKVLSWMPGIWKRRRPRRTGVLSIHRWCWVPASLHHPDWSTPSPCPWNDLRLTSPGGPRMWFCSPDPLHCSVASITWLTLCGFYLVILVPMTTGYHNVTPDNKGYLMNSLLKDWLNGWFFFNCLLYIGL